MSLVLALLLTALVIAFFPLTAGLLKTLVFVAGVLVLFALLASLINSNPRI